MAADDKGLDRRKPTGGYCREVRRVEGVEVWPDGVRPAGWGSAGGAGGFKPAAARQNRLKSVGERVSGNRGGFESAGVYTASAVSSHTPKVG